MKGSANQTKICINNNCPLRVQKKKEFPAAKMISVFFSMTHLYTTTDLLILQMLLYFWE